MGRRFTASAASGRLGRRRWSSTRRRITTRRTFSETLESRVLLAADLVAHWRADSLNDGHANGAAISAWTDSVGSIEAEAKGTPVLVKDAWSGRSVVRFDASDEKDSFLVPGTSSPMTGAEDFSVAVTFATSSNDLQGAATNWYDNTGLVDSTRLGFAKDWGLSLNEAGQVGVGLGEGLFDPSYSTYSSETDLNDGQIHQATFLRSGSTMYLYVDGVESSQVSDVSSSPRDAIDLVFGVLQTGQNPLTGDLADIRVYDGALDATEVSGLYQEIVAYYNNTAPIAQNDSYSLDEGPPFDLFPVSPAEGVLQNDTDAESDPMTAVLISGTTHGTVTLQPDGSFVYSPPSDFFGTDSFTYAARDPQQSNVATVTLNVANVYDPAVPVADQYKTEPHQTLDISAAEGLLANDLNPDQVTLTVQLETAVDHGQLTWNSDGSFQYDPQGFAGMASFRYQINDGTGLSAPVPVTIRVNTPPVAVDDTYAVDEDMPLVRAAHEGIAANDSDAEGQTLTAALIELPAHGSLDLAADGGFEYLPDADYFGTDQFTYQLSDGEDLSRVATVHLTVHAVNDPPIGQEDAYYGVADQPLVVDVERGVLGNDSDVDSPTLTIAVPTGPQHGQLDWQASGAFTYTPPLGFKGTDTFSYVVQDGQAASDPILVSLFIGSSPVRISEVMAANVNTLQTRVREEPDGQFRGERLSPDWIEVQNLTSSALDVSGFHLTDQDQDPLRWQFPAETMIPANGYLVVFADRLNITDPALDELGHLHTNFKLGVEGEYLAITSAQGEVLHAYEPGYPQLRADVSYGMTVDGTEGYLLAATPGEENSEMYAGMVQDTNFSIDRGFFSEAFPVEISTGTPDATIRYTLDGSPPDSSHGEVYTAPIMITTTTVLKAAAFRDDYLPSDIDAQTYIFGADVLQQDGSDLGGVRWGHAGPDWEMDPLVVNDPDPEIRPEVEDLLRLPTVSLSLDFDEMWGTNGIYIRGENVERPVSFEFLDPARLDNGIQTNSTVQIVGGSSPSRWKVDKLSMRVRFTEDIGESALDYPVFGSDATDLFDTLVIDARMNNTWHYGGGVSPTFQRDIAQYLRDEFAADMQNAMGGYGPHLQHVHVYINGIYWGMHILHERPDDNFAASYLGGFSEDYDVLKHTVNEVVNGTNESFRELSQTLGTSGDLSDEDYQRVPNCWRSTSSSITCWSIFTGATGTGIITTGTRRGIELTANGSFTVGTPRKCCSRSTMT